MGSSQPPGAAYALRSRQALDAAEMAGLDPGFAAFRPGLGPKRASGRKPKPGLRFEPVFAVLEEAFEHQELRAAGGVERDGPIRRPAFEPNVLALIAKQRNHLHARPGGRRCEWHYCGIEPDLRAVLRIERSNCQSLTKMTHPDAEPGVWCDVGGLRMYDPAGKSPCSSWKTPSRTRNSSPPP